MGMDDRGSPERKTQYWPAKVLGVLGRKGVAKGPRKMNRERALYYAVITLLAGFALSIYHRPNLPFIFPSYHFFDDVMPYVWWGWTGIGIAVWMLFSRPGGLNSMSATMSAAIWFSLAAGAFGASGGFTSAVSTYSILALWCLWLFSVELDMYIEASPITNFIVRLVKRRLP